MSDDLSSSSADEVRNTTTTASAVGTDPALPAPKRRRGRPRKYPLPEQTVIDTVLTTNEAQAGPQSASSTTSAASTSSSSVSVGQAGSEDVSVTPPKRKRGRPKGSKNKPKVKPEDAGTVASSTNKVPSKANVAKRKALDSSVTYKQIPTSYEQSYGLGEQDLQLDEDLGATYRHTARKIARRRIKDQTASEKTSADTTGDIYRSSYYQNRRNNGNQNTQNGQSGQHSTFNQNVLTNQTSPSSQNTLNNQNQLRRRTNRRAGQPMTEPSLTLDELKSLKVRALREKALELGIDFQGLRKRELVEKIYNVSAHAEGFHHVMGFLEIGNEGYGWIRSGMYMSGDNDAFIHQQLIRQYQLRAGDYVQAEVGPGRPNSKYPPVISVSLINGVNPEELTGRPRFRDLVPIFPNERLRMEFGKESITGRAIDLVAPIGKGQRGLIVSPPKAGKTTVLKKICQSITANNPEVHLICLLVDERPEEVTDMQRSIQGEVVASTFDMPAENHTSVSELVIEHAKRLVEQGRDVVVVLDSITRLARAYNLAQPPSGRVLSGGVDSAALYPPKKFLGAARNIENGGSLTIIASALIETGSKMDEVIFEEFKGTGNMELKLDRELADKRIFPAIDPVSSGTRNENLLIQADFQPFVWGIRRVLANMGSTERAANALVKGLKGTDNNEEFLIKSAKKAQQQIDFAAN